MANTETLPSQQDEANDAARNGGEEGGNQHERELRSYEDIAKDTRTVFERMVAIVDELPAIGKTQKNTQQNFMFRGHDDVLNALNPLLSKHGVFVVPHVVERVTDQRTTGGGKVMYEVNLHVEYTFYGSRGDSFVASAWGEGTDMGDKATNKAMTMAMKAVLNQAFAINTEEVSAQDADKHTPEETVVRRDVAVENESKPPQTWGEALKRFDTMMGSSGEGSPWLEELVEVRWGVSSLADLNAAQKREALIGFSSPLMMLEEQGDVGLQKDPRALIRAAFAMKNQGVQLDGPPWRISSGETDRPTRDEYLSKGEEGDAGEAGKASDA